MRKIIIVVALAVLFNACGTSKSLLSENTGPILTTIDLVNVVDDRVRVEINPRAFTTETVLFRIPKTVPGTYSSDNYGKYIQDFKALDYKGNQLEVVNLDENSWSISNGNQLDKVEYSVLQKE